MAKNPEFKAPSGVHVKMPDEAPDIDNFMFATPTAEPVAAGAAAEWLEMPEAPVGVAGAYPFDGRPVVLTSGQQNACTAVWRVSREFYNGRFNPVAFWATYNAGGSKVPFEPIGWREYVEPIYVPQRKVAS